MWEFFTRDVELEMRPVFCLHINPSGRGFVFWGEIRFAGPCHETANHGTTSLRGDVYLTSVGGRLVVFDQMLKGTPDPG